MAWREDITVGLPPQRRDEPGDLRRDIVDELADHLGCAMKRELRGTTRRHRPPIRRVAGCLC